jgi:hypothetical protein
MAAPEWHMRLLILLLLLLSPALYGKQRDFKAATAEKKARTTSQKPAESEMPPRLVIGSVERWQAQAEQMFPELRQANSEFRAEFLTAQKVMQQKSPDFFLANDWPVRLAETVARSLKPGHSAPLAAVNR